MQTGSSKRSDFAILEIFGRLHRLTRGAFSAAEHVLARAKPLGSSSRESNAVTKQGFSEVVDRVLHATECLTESVFHL